ncbi:MAG: glycosyltransferase family A protein [Bacillota bacterium]
MGRATATGGVSIITCTNRPQFFDNILENYIKQQYRKKELIIILNNDSMNLEQFQGKIRTYNNIKVYKLPEKYH